MECSEEDKEGANMSVGEWGNIRMSDGLYYSRSVLQPSLGGNTRTDCSFPSYSSWC
jgi:hypothetical protein